MASAIRFQQIVDSRNKGDTKALLERRVNQIKSNLMTLPGVTVRAFTPRKVFFGPPEPSTQWRVDFYVTKTGRASTWNDVYKAVNKVKPAYFKKEVKQ